MGHRCIESAVGARSPLSIRVKTKLRWTGAAQLSTPDLLASGRRCDPASPLTYAEKIRNFRGKTALRYSVMKPRRRVMALASAALFGTSAMFVVSKAHAQVTTPTGVSEIVVTAEKRESTVQKTPLSVTAISGQE